MAGLSQIALLIFVAAPGDRISTIDEVPALAKAAIERRLGVAVELQISQVKPSQRMPGYIACGLAVEPGSTGRLAQTERFFAVVPGNFAVLDRDGRDLVDTYWRLNQC